MVGSESASGEENIKLPPVVRLFHLLATDKKDIFYVYVYALIIGIMIGTYSSLFIATPIVIDFYGEDKK